VAESPDAIREAIDTTRADLADTIQALGHKADVKGRVSDKVHETAHEVGERVDAATDSVKPVAQVVGKTTAENRGPVLVGLALVTTLLFFLPWWRRRHRRS
jgi:uncharacterized protein DUF3618